MQIRLDDLRVITIEPGFFSKAEVYTSVLKEIKLLESKINGYDKLKQNYAYLKDYANLVLEEGETDLEDEIIVQYKEFINDYKSMKSSMFLKGKHDADSAMLTLHSGAGGTESDDWVRILFRMYSRWAEKKGYTLNILDFLPGEVVGMKYVTLEILGENASGYLKSETGVHRLIRISPFDSSAKRHTTFASCSVIPLLENDLDKIDIRPEDIRVDTYRRSGSGGQHVNTTDSAVRITHIPTNIVAQCQSDRSQYKNKEVALKILKNKLLQLKEKEKFDSMAHIREEEKDISWGSQIRTYVFNPYSMVKDHRTNKETANINAVLDGDIDDFINAYL